MSKKRIAVIGAGMMARIRGRAFLQTGQTEICAVASQHRATAQRCAAELGATLSYDDFRRIDESQPDAVLIEVPHSAHDVIVPWALEAGFDVLIGGNLASSVKTGRKILELATHYQRIVEVGFQCRYEPAWKAVRRLVNDNTLGEPIMAVSMAFFKPNPHSWYYDQEASGGMPLTHLSYVHLNAIRWVLGKPTAVTAMANRKVETAPSRVTEESCAVLLRFENDCFASLTASYTAPGLMSSASPRFICTDGGIQISIQRPHGIPSITVFRKQNSEVRSFQIEPASFVLQAQAFLSAIKTRRSAQNPPVDALVDVRVAKAISISCRESRTVALDEGSL